MDLNLNENCCLPKNQLFIKEWKFKPPEVFNDINPRALHTHTAENIHTVHTYYTHTHSTHLLYTYTQYTLIIHIHTA